MGTAEGRLDAVVFGVGILVGILVFGELYSFVGGFVVSGDLGVQTMPGYLGLNRWVVALGVVTLTLGSFWIARVAERRFGRSIE